MLHAPYLAATSPTATKPAHLQPRASELAAVVPSAFADDDYVMFETLGRGGMGEVRRGVDLKRGGSVAIKFMHRSLARKPRLVSQFRNEGDMVASVSHRNVVALLGCFDQTDRHYLVFEYIRGRSLRDCINDDALCSNARFTAIARQLTSAIAAVHRAGIVHGDIKSANVMIGPSLVDDHVTLLDFGLAHRTAPAFAIDRDISGTPGYMAPELLCGELSTYASDQFALGVVLYETLTGVHPFAHQGAAGEAALDSDVPWLPILPSACAPDRNIGPGLDNALLRMLAHNPADRFASLAALQPLALW